MVRLVHLQALLAALLPECIAKRRRVLSKFIGETQEEFSLPSAS